MSRKSENQQRYKEADRHLINYLLDLKHRCSLLENLKFPKTEWPIDNWIYTYRSHPKYISSVRKAIGGRQGLLEFVSNANNLSDAFSQFICDNRDIIHAYLISKSDEEDYPTEEGPKNELSDSNEQSISGTYDLACSSKKSHTDSNEYKEYIEHKAINDVEWIAESFNQIPSVATLNTPHCVYHTEPAANPISMVVLKAPVFPIVIYAPPASGKTTFRLKNPGHVCDTDDFYNMDFRNICVTNMPMMMKYGQNTIAVVPTNKEFNTRCRQRGLMVQDQWYLDLLNYLKYANVIFFSNKFVSMLIEVSELQHLLRKNG